ncbi:MAG: hypothetical protein ACTSV7_08175 [Candidatus Baldrarchaeia archaeon]
MFPLLSTIAGMIISMVIDFLNLFCALLLASYTVIGGTTFTTTYIKKALYSSLLTLPLWIILPAVIKSPLIVAIIAALCLGYAVNRFYKRGDWFIIYLMSIIFIFIFWLIYSIIIAILFGRGY